MTSLSSASRAGHPVMRLMCWARMVVKVAGMCWVIRIGRLIVGLMPPSNVNRACGPPVELPMARTSTDRIPGPRSGMDLPGVTVGTPDTRIAGRAGARLSAGPRSGRRAVPSARTFSNKSRRKSDPLVISRAVGFGM